MSDKLSKHEWDDPNNPEGYCVHCGSARKDLEKIAALEAKLSKMEELLYEAIEVGGAPESTWVDTDDETKRAWPISDEEALAGGEEA